MSLLLCWERKLALIGTEQKVDALRSVADMVGKDTDIANEELICHLSRKLQFRLRTIGFAVLGLPDGDQCQMFDGERLNSCYLFCWQLVLWHDVVLRVP
ncbi:unnamed protein product [Sphenostylis stenocarpa]|uniref:Uncharacterized protein n=1 Tax=Sphenostylis stenocarpa TaxID=92480 RepID=A0AA86T0R3_9FABA|nr:unnamed protein product [Sphenostylis stenocarpa]